MNREFPGARGAVLLDPGGSFRALETQDGTEAWLCGTIDASTAELAEPSKLSDPFGRYVLLVHHPGRRSLAIHTC